MKLVQTVKNYLTILGIGSFLLPIKAFSQFSGGVVACDNTGFGLIGANFSCTVRHIINLINLLVPIMAGGAFIVFFWGLSKFILNAGSPVEIQKGKSYMFWGILALFVLITIRTIISLIVTGVGLGGTGTVIPVLPGGLPN